jgi:hypothetical protein
MILSRFPYLNLFKLITSTDLLEYRHWKEYSSSMEENIDCKNWHLIFQILFFSEYVQELLIMFEPFIIELFMLIVISIPLEFIQL